MYLSSRYFLKSRLENINLEESLDKFKKVQQCSTADNQTVYDVYQVPFDILNEGGY